MTKSPSLDRKNRKSVKVKANTLSQLKLVKFKEKVNEKIFSRMVMNSMSPQQQKKIKERFDRNVSLRPVISHFRSK